MYITKLTKNLTILILKSISIISKYFFEALAELLLRKLPKLIFVHFPEFFFSVLFSNLFNSTIGDPDDSDSPKRSECVGDTRINDSQHLLRVNNERWL